MNSQHTFTITDPNAITDLVGNALALWEVRADQTIRTASGNRYHVLQSCYVEQQQQLPTLTLIVEDAAA